MINRKKLDIRIEGELHSLLRSKAGKNFTSFVESLIVKGLMTDMNDLYERAVNKGDAFRKTVEEKEIIELKKSNEEIKKELSTQSKY